ncbi:hypothetical protein JNB_04665 [Janibacter sp. HTCC2649]|uniref:hypothetical protein n=1 Tax=Janibacter sp. HTCC2649 TaxID=313589 RepID=UPI000066EA38|nr:hypothetical protein [Janibacter sp. HTCC2649]EAP99435.1 hypothetical protein JNB_04665 [Janibacter sp. HTCC2649]
MPSNAFAARKHADLDQPGLSPNEAKSRQQFWDHLEKNEQNHFTLMGHNEVAETDALRTRHEQQCKEAIQPLIEGLKQAEARGKSASEIAALREEIQDFIAYYAGDGKDRQGRHQHDPDRLCTR